MLDEHPFGGWNLPVMRRYSITSTLAEKSGVSQAAIIELALREYAGK
jgi:hypothetical protein